MRFYEFIFGFEKCGVFESMEFFVWVKRKNWLLYIFMIIGECKLCDSRDSVFFMFFLSLLCSKDFIFVE